MNRKFIGLALVLGLSAIALAACGGDNTTTPATTSPAPGGANTSPAATTSPATSPATTSPKASPSK